MDALIRSKKSLLLKADFFLLYMKTTSSAGCAKSVKDTRFSYGKIIKSERCEELVFVVSEIRNRGPMLL